jgi:hypothetical protein
MANTHSTNTCKRNLVELLKGMQLLLHMWHPLCYELGDIMKEPDCAYDKRNTSVFIYDTDIP